MPGKVAARVRRKNAAGLAVEHEEADRRGGEPAALGQLRHHLVEALAVEVGAEEVELGQLQLGDEAHSVEP